MNDPWHLTIAERERLKSRFHIEMKAGLNHKAVLPILAHYDQIMSECLISQFTIRNEHGEVACVITEKPTIKRGRHV